MSENPTFNAPEVHELASLFSGYAIEHLIACGGMGAVYKARQIALDREVAIKILPRELSRDASFREGFAAEAKAMAKLNHPNLISVFDFGEVDGMLFIIMEFVPGQSLYHATYNKRMEPRQVAKMISEIGAGLHHAHEHGILHRDIKPANVLLDAQQRPKIGDFGLARPIGFANADDETIYGTPHYTAPEIINQPHQVDARADVFSLGVMLHELLTGKMPADDNRLPSVICGCPKGFDAIIRKATAPVSTQRYATVAAMMQDLHQLVFPSTNPKLRAGYPQGPKVAASRPVTAALPRTAPRAAAARQTKSSSSGNLVWLLVLALLIAGGVIYLQQQPNPGAPTLPPAAAPATPSKTATASQGTTTLPTETDSSRSPSPIHSTNQPNDATKQSPLIPRPTEDPKSSDITSNTPTENGSDIPRLTKPENATPAEIKPKEPPFDVEAFFQRAKSVMRDKSSVAITARRTALTKNLEAFGRQLERQARTIDSRENKRIAAESIQMLIEKLKDDEALIPEFTKLQLPYIPEASIAHSSYLQKQEEIEEQFIAACSDQAQLYIKGIELQIERLNPTQQQVAIDALNDEISQTRNDNSHFADVLLSREKKLGAFKQPFNR